MREHKNHPVIFSGLRCSIPLPKLNHFLIKILKSNGFLIEKTKICFEFWRRRRQPKILIYIFLPDLAPNYWNSQRFFNKILVKTTFSWSKHEDSSKKFLPSLLKIAKIFMIFNFFNKISQNHTKFAKKHGVPAPRYFKPSVYSFSYLKWKSDSNLQVLRSNLTRESIKVPTKYAKMLKNRTFRSWNL